MEPPYMNDVMSASMAYRGCGQPLPGSHVNAMGMAMRGCTPPYHNMAPSQRSFSPPRSNMSYSPPRMSMNQPNNGRFTPPGPRQGSRPGHIPRTPLTPHTPSYSTRTVTPPRRSGFPERPNFQERSSYSDRQGYPDRDYDPTSRAYGMDTFNGNFNANIRERFYDSQMYDDEPPFHNGGINSSPQFPPGTQRPIVGARSPRRPNSFTGY